MKPIPWHADIFASTAVRSSKFVAPEAYDLTIAAVAKNN